MHEFTQRFPRRVVVIDASGIQCTTNKGKRSIDWADLTSITTAGATGRDGTSISLHYGPLQQKMTDLISRLWREKYPDRWEANEALLAVREEKVFRELAVGGTGVCVLLPCILFLVKACRSGWPQEVRSIAPLCAVAAILGIIFLAGFCIWRRTKPKDSHRTSCWR